MGSSTLVNQGAFGKPAFREIVHSPDQSVVEWNDSLRKLLTPPVARSSVVVGRAIDIHNVKLSTRGDELPGLQISFSADSVIVARSSFYDQKFWYHNFASLLLGPKWKASGFTHVETPAWSPNASPREIEILFDLVKHNRRDVAERLDVLIDSFARDSDVGGLNIDSIKSVAKFFKQNEQLKPNIVADWDGLLAVNWRLHSAAPLDENQTCEGILHLEFLPDEQIEFLGFVRATSDSERIDYDDVAGHENIIEQISSFLQRL